MSDAQATVRHRPRASIDPPDGLAADTVQRDFGWRQGEQAPEILATLRHPHGNRRITDPPTRQAGTAQRRCTVGDRAAPRGRDTGGPGGGRRQGQARQPCLTRLRTQSNDDCAALSSAAFLRCCVVSAAGYGSPGSSAFALSGNFTYPLEHGTGFLDNELIFRENHSRHDSCVLTSINRPCNACKGIRADGGFTISPARSNFRRFRDRWLAFVAGRCGRGATARP